MRLEAGAHCFRRFRAAQLQRAAYPDDLRECWLGHASSDISDQYALQLLEDVERRKAAAASVGLDCEVADSPCNFHCSGLVEAADQPVTQ
jgi:integrase